MFGMVANGTLPDRKSICSPLKSKVSISWFHLNFWFVIEIITYEDYMCVKIFHLKCVYTGQPVSEISEFLTAYIHKCTVETIVSYNASY